MAPPTTGGNRRQSSFRPSQTSTTADSASFRTSAAHVNANSREKETFQSPRASQQAQFTPARGSSTDCPSPRGLAILPLPNLRRGDPV